MPDTASNCLTLPSFHKDVPLKFDIVLDYDSFHLIADILEKRKLLKVGKDLISSVNDSMSDWLSKLKVDYNLFFGLNRLNSRVKGMSAQLGFSEPYFYVVGSQLQKLQDMDGSLGAYALRALQNCPFLIYTPYEMLMFCERYYWMGETDEKGIIEEHVAQGEKAEDLDIFTKKKFESNFPLWSYDYKEAPGYLPPKEYDIFRKLFDLNEEYRKIVKPEYEYNDEYESVDLPGIVLRWTDDDVAAKFTDDSHEEACSCGNEISISPMWFPLQSDSMWECMIKEIDLITKILDTVYTITEKTLK